MNNWYQIKNNKQANGLVEIYIDNEIGEFGIPARQFLNELKACAGSPVDIHINSPGGSLIDAFAIYDMVKLQGYKMTAYISGIAASAATVVSMAAEKTFMGEHSYYFIHDPYYSSGEGPDADLSKMKADIIHIYAAKTGLPADQLSEMMSEETLLSAQEALEMGFVDGIVTEKKVAAQLDKHLNKLPKHIADQLATQVDTGILNAFVGKLAELDHWAKNAIRQTAVAPQYQLIEPINNNKNQTKSMENNQELEAKLDELIQQLTDLLAQLQGKQPEKPSKEADKEADKAKEMQEKDKEIEALGRELDRVKARRVQLRGSKLDAAPAGGDEGASDGWGYVSKYLQNRFR